MADTMELLGERQSITAEELYRKEKEYPPWVTKAFSFEEELDVRYIVGWLQANWHTSIYYAVAYLLTLFLLTKWMESRKRFEMKTALVLWNAALAVFSIATSARILPEFIRVLMMEDGYHNSICDLRYSKSPAFFYWSWLFVLSKVAELGDTIFIVLRKRPLTVLHVYHHFSVLIFTWYIGAEQVPSIRWFVGMNGFVHSIMYTYFAIQILRLFKIPRFISMSITIIQIVQMILGIAITVHAYNVKRSGRMCDQTDRAIYATAGIYFSYFVLFAWFFYTSYFVKGKKKVA